jgi:nitrate reductase NapD
MDISSVVLRANPRKLATVRDGLAAIPEIEVHTDLDDGRFVLILEGSASTPGSEAFARVQKIEGVLSASLVYQYCDDMQLQERQT